MENFIDVKRIIKNKNPRALRWLPPFVIRYLKRIFHQEEINAILSETQSLKNHEFCSELIKRFNLKVKVRGIEKIPKDQRIIFAINHPLGGFDALALSNQIGILFPQFKFMVNDVLLNIKNVDDFMVGVNKLGVKSRDSVRQVNELFDSENAIFIFPAGLVSRKIDGIIQDVEWQKTFISRARKHKRTVIPVHISGSLSPFFYRLSKFRKRVGIKSNIEMMYLVNETFKLKNQTLIITIGDPISYDTFSKQKTDEEWASEVRKITYSLNR